MTDPTICDVFDRLDKWRHFPNYQLERRADIYFAMFLPDVLKARYGPCQIIPEFPLRHGTLGTDKESTGKGGIGANQSVKVDYAAFTKDPQAVYFVELKTDCSSVSLDQAKYLKKAKGLEFRKLADGIDYIIENKKTKQLKKYKYLRKRLSDLSVLDLAQRPEIVYILPERTQECTEVKGAKNVDLKKFASIITFEEFAKEAEKHGPLGERFAKSLVRWVEPAGSQKP